MCAIGEGPRDWLKPAGFEPSASRSPRPLPPPRPTLPPSIPFAPGLPPRPAFRSTAPARAACSRPVRRRRRVMLMADLPGPEEAAARPANRRRGMDAGAAHAAGDRDRCRCRLPRRFGLLPLPGARLDKDDLDRCGTLARHHIRLAAPQRLILFGDAPARALLGQPLGEARGRVHRVEGVRTIATFHPRWLLAAPVGQGAGVARPVAVDE